ncbi:MAG: hypothetical protein C5B49_14515 [Bdellovibrio sp.]|nr:MAG: hypothetical protein C5B49_14515 [Bdellovibrio sp.]
MLNTVLLHQIQGHCIKMRIPLAWAAKPPRVKFAGGVRLKMHKETRKPIDYRMLFALDDDVIHFNAASVTPHPKVVVEAGQAALEVRRRPWEISTHHFSKNMEQLRGLIAKHLHCSVNSVALVPTVSHGMETVARNIELGSSDEVLIPSADFPSCYFAWRNACNRSGAELVLAPRPRLGDWTETILQHIGRRTRVVVVPQTDWSNGTHFDLKKIREATKAVGALMVNDISQSFCAAPYSVEEIQPDIVLSVGYKWQLGPHGLSFMYVAPEYYDWEPLETNWLDRANSADFTRHAEFRDDDLPGARRFDSGQRSQLQLVPMALAAQSFINEIGVADIFQNICGLNKWIAAGLSELGCVVVPDADRTGHLLAFSLPNWEYSASLMLALKENNISLSLRDHKYFRVSPHIYNTAEEADRFLEVMKELLQSHMYFTSRSRATDAASG